MCYNNNEAEEEEESLIGFHVCVADGCMGTVQKMSTGWPGFPM